MTRKIFVYCCSAFVALTALLLSPGGAMAFSSRDATYTVGQPPPAPEKRWNWFNPLDGAYFSMKGFEDGTVVAVRQQMALSARSGNFERTPDVFFQPSGQSDGRQGGARIADTRVSSLDMEQSVYELWKERKLACGLTRSVPDLFGNIAKICRISPFSIKFKDGTLSTVKGGVVWIITPTVSGSQQPSTRGSQPGWGR
ncbi:MAG: hypothetical protein RQ767_03410 [Thermovirgaceae bacterium]|nr:hypothetical protein [Thermovirgaceae bacterium]